MEDPGSVFEKAWRLLSEGRVRDAEGLLGEVLRLFSSPEVNDVGGQANCYHGLGNCARSQGKLEDAEGLYQKALALYLETRVPQGQADCYLRLGFCAWNQGRGTDTERFYKKALRLYEVCRDLSGFLNSSTHLCRMFLKRERHEDCREHAHEALVQFDSTLSFLGGRDVAHFLDESLDLFELYAMTLLRLERYKEAYEILALTKEGKATKEEAIGSRGLSAALRAIGSGQGLLFDKALERLPDEATAVVDLYVLEMGTVIFILQKGRGPEGSVRTVPGMSWAEHSSLIESGWLRSYYRYQYFMNARNILWKSYRKAVAEVGDRLVADVLLRELLERIKEKLVTEELLEEPATEEEEEREKEEKEIPLGVELVGERVKAVLEELEWELRAWEEGGEGRQDWSFEEVLRVALERPEGELRAQMLAELDNVLKELHTRLFEDSGFLEAISGKMRRVIFVPTRELFLIPLHAAYNEVNGARKYILSYFEEVRYLPSVYFFTRSSVREDSGPVGLVLSKVEGDLPFGEKQFEDIKSRLQGTEVIELRGREVTREALRRLLSRPLRRLYYLGHFQYNMTHPETDSSFKIPDLDNEGEYEFFTLKMLREVDIDVGDLVALACETAMSKLQKRDEYLGLPRLFLEKGTREVLATCWEVGDEVCYQMTRQWGPDLSPSTVLGFQKSMSMGNSNGAFESPPTTRSADPDYRPSTPDVDYSHPFYWAAFVYYGE